MDLDFHFRENYRVLQMRDNTLQFGLQGVKRLKCEYKVFKCALMWGVGF